MYRVSVKEKEEGVLEATVWFAAPDKQYCDPIPFVATRKTKSK